MRSAGVLGRRLDLGRQLQCRQRRATAQRHHVCRQHRHDHFHQQYHAERRPAGGEKNVTILGIGNTLSGNNQFRGLFVGAFSGSTQVAVTVSIQDLTIANTKATGGNGGGGAGGGLGLGASGGSGGITNGLAGLATGASAGGTPVAPQTTNSVRTVLGAALAAAFALGSHTLDLDFRLGWRHEHARQGR